MLKCLIFVCTLISSNVMFTCSAEKMLGAGQWTVISTEKCEESAISTEKVKVEVKKHKMNRTHDGFDGKLQINEDIDDSFGALLEVCKHVDGGCKQYQVLSDDSIVRFIEKYAKDLAVELMQRANIDPPEFPLAAGEFNVADFILDYCKLPLDCVYGRFTAYAFLLKGNERVACLKVTVEFNETDEDMCAEPEECDDCDE